MKTAAIYLHGIPGVDIPTPVKTIIYQDEQKLTEELKKLQSGYCEGERPTLKKFTKMINGKTRQIIAAFSESDFHYAAMLGFKLKDSAGKPIETI